MDVTVLGAGPLGRDLSAVAARTGHTVSLHDPDATAAMDVIDEIERRLGDDVDTGNVAPSAREAAIGRLDATTGLEAAVGDADVVVVTGRSDETELQADFAEVEAFVDRDAVIATSARDCAVTVVAAGLQHPDRAIGLYLDDLREATVAEVVVADQTADSTLEQTTDFVGSLGLVPAPVADEPGVVSTRLTLLVEVEAMRLVEDGVASVTAVDDAFALRHGHPMGPLERADRAGLDRRHETLSSLTDVLGHRFQPPELLSELVSAGHTGARYGEGFYVWENDEPTGPAVPAPNLAERVASPDDPAR